MESTTKLDAIIVARNLIVELRINNFPIQEPTSPNPSTSWQGDQKDTPDAKVLRAMTSWLWFEDPADRSAEDNMAIDGRLLDAQNRSPDSLPIVRIYSWREPAVTFGRLQNIESVRAAYPNLELARRPTGGRAVLHGGDLTVTVALREPVPGDERTATVNGSFRVIAQPVINTLIAVGINCGFGDGRRRADNGVDCFTHAASCDIVNYDTHIKIVGCAQRRVGSAILQQMSIVGMSENRGFIAILRDAMSGAFGVDRWSFVDSRMALCYTGPISRDATVQGREQL